VLILFKQFQVIPNLFYLTA